MPGGSYTYTPTAANLATSPGAAYPTSGTASDPFARFIEEMVRRRLLAAGSVPQPGVANRAARPAAAPMALGGASGGLRERPQRRSEYVSLPQFGNFMGGGSYFGGYVPTSTGDPQGVATGALRVPRELLDYYTRPGNVEFRPIDPGDAMEARRRMENWEKTQPGNWGS